MNIDWQDFERGTSPEGDDEAQLKALQTRLARLQVAHHCHGRRALILFEGWDAAGKGGAIKRLTAEWDPRFFDVYPIGAPSAEERARHFLWRFWTRLPAAGNIAVFDRSWYGRVLVERVEGLAHEAEWRRAYDEINEFEAQQADSGTTIVKLFLHITQQEQDKRLRERLQDPWKRWKTGLEDYRNRARRADYLEAMAEMLRRTDSRWAPWAVIDGNNKKAARIAALQAVADRLAAFVPMTPPPLDPELARVAQAALGA